MNAPADDRSQRLRQSVVQLALAVLALAAAGVLAGVVWEWVWTAPLGSVVDQTWVAEDEESLRGVFSATGWYVVIGAVAGLLGGALVALFLDRSPLITLVGVVIGSALGAFLMLRVGVALGPADPVGLAESAREGAYLPAMLGVSGSTPFVALPAGALVALAMVFLGLSAAQREPAEPGASVASDPGEDRTGDPDQVGRREAQVEPPPPA
ncbi:MAG: hypothetical protein WBP61_01355 [Nocardioides sp.]